MDQIVRGRKQKKKHSLIHSRTNKAHSINNPRPVATQPKFHGGLIQTAANKRFHQPLIQLVAEKLH